MSNTISYRELKDWYIKNDDAVANAKKYFGKTQPSILATGFYSAPSWNWGYKIGLCEVDGVGVFEVVTQFGEVVAARREHLPKIKPTSFLEYLRGELQAERISYGELAELQDVAHFISAGDVELLEAAGIPEGETPDYYLKHKEDN